MIKKLQEYIHKDLEELERNTELSIQDRQRKINSVSRYLALNEEFDELLNSDGDLYQIIRKHNHRKKEDLKSFLHNFDPYQFELLVSKLIERMGYKIELTNKSNDLGIDIVATKSIGLTPVREVIQVKRKKDNIHRPVLDQLRGAMPLHNATAGCIITLSNFSDNCYTLAPKNITLINGEELIHLLFKHQVGFRAATIEVFNLDYNFLETLEV